MSDIALQVVCIDHGHFGDSLSACHPYHPWTFHRTTKSF